MWPLIKIGTLTFPTFYIIISLSCTLALLLISKKLNKFKKYNPQIAFDLITLILISGFIGGRLLHVIFEEPQYYQQDFIRIFKFWNGGFVYYGGLIAASLMSFIYLKSKKEHFLTWADFLTPSFSLVYGLGRLGCFFQGCCYGLKCELPWSIDHRHPTQLYMVASELILFFFVSQMKLDKNKGHIFFTWLIFHSLTRLIIEFYRDDERGLLFLNTFSISQIISIVILAISFSYFKLQSKKN